MAALAEHGRDVTPLGPPLMASRSETFALRDPMSGLAVGCSAEAGGLVSLYAPPTVL